MTNDEPPLSPETRLRQRLARLSRRCGVVNAGAFLLVVLGAAGAGVALVSLAYWSGWVALLLLIPTLLLGVRWRQEFSPAGVARLAEREFGEVRGRLVAALEIAKQGRGGREAYSTELVGAAVAQVDALMARLPPGRLVRRHRLAWGGLCAVGGQAVLVLAMSVVPQRFLTGYLNAFRPHELQVAFEVAPGDTAVLPGTDVELSCVVKPAGRFGRVTLELHGPAAAASRALADSVGGFSAVVPVDGEFAYRFRVLGRTSAEHRVSLLEPLVVEQLTFACAFPDYTGLEPSRTAGTDLAVPRGTLVRFEGRANHELAGGCTRAGGDSGLVDVGRGDARDFSGQFQVRTDAERLIEIRDKGGLQARVTLRVRAIADEPPLVRVLLPGRDVDLPAEMRVPLVVNSLDDYGLDELSLWFGKESVNQRVRIRALRGRREDTTFYVWDLSRSDLLPGEKLRYFLSVTDNDAVAGPKTGRSAEFTVRFPTMAEIYDAAVNQTRRTAEQLGTMPAQQSVIGQELARVADELKRNRELTWDERQKLEQVIGRQESLLGAMDQLGQDVARAAEDLAQGLNFDRETMEQLGQVQEMLAQLLPRELQEALAELRERLQQNSPGIEQALERTQMAQDQLKAGLERVLELLKRAMQEQRLEALARKAEELRQTQQQLTEALNRDRPEGLAQRQQDIAAGLDSLRQEMERLAADIAGNDSGRGAEKDIADSLGALSTGLQEQQTGEQSAQLARQLQSGQMQNADRQSRELTRQFENLAQSLQSLSRQLKDRRSSRAAEKLAGSAADLLMLSDQQEQAEQALSGLPDPSGLAGRQMGLVEGTRVAAESLAGLGGQTMAVPPELGRVLAQAMNAMQSAAEDLALGRSGAARNRMAQARQGLNSAAAMLLDALGQAQQGGGAGGDLESLLEQLSRMAQQQMGINAGMDGIPIPIPMPGGLTPQQMQQLSRLLAQQQALRQQLQQMLQSMGGQRPGLTASLERLLDEMQAVERDMADLNVSREMVERQEGILQHLLDAERSVRQQGFKEERQSETGKPFELTGRPELPQDRGERNRLLREELMRALKQGYPAEYEQMIRAYFDRLLNEQ